MLEVADHLLGIVRLAGELQRQPACGVGPQLKHADVVEQAAAQGWQIVAGGGRELELAGGLGITGQGGGEGLAHRADLEQGVFADRLLAVLGGDTVVKVSGLAVLHDGDCQAGNCLLLHQGLDGGVHHLAQIVGGHAVARAEQ